MKTTICPKCNKPYNLPPAISREDNKTLICPECGTREALLAMGMSPENCEIAIQVITETIAEIEK